MQLVEIYKNNNGAENKAAFQHNNFCPLIPSPLDGGTDGRTRQRKLSLTSQSDH